VNILQCIIKNLTKTCATQYKKIAYHISYHSTFCPIFLYFLMDHVTLNRLMAAEHFKTSSNRKKYFTLKNITQNYDLQ